MKESESKSMGYKAGGCLWCGEETQGKTHLVRAEQNIKSNADTVVTAYNFYFAMMNQGLDPLTHQNKEPLKLKNIADIAAQYLV